jgi:hypothetical protein
MNETEWLRCTDLERMLAHLGNGISERKCRLYAIACCHRLWGNIRSPRVRAAIEVIERWADGTATREEARDARETVTAGDLAFVHIAVRGDARSAALWVASQANAFRGLLAEWQLQSAEEARQAERQAQLALLRDIAGNPFRRPALSPLALAWGDRQIPKLAEAIYAERAFDRLPILADALEDAGCTEQAILTHLRGEGPHVRGCWVVDMVLGKS